MSLCNTFQVTDARYIKSKYYAAVDKIVQRLAAELKWISWNGQSNPETLLHMSLLADSAEVLPSYYEDSIGSCGLDFRDVTSLSLSRNSGIDHYYGHYQGRQSNIMRTSVQNHWSWTSNDVWLLTIQKNALVFTILYHDFIYSIGNNWKRLPSLCH